MAPTVLTLGCLLREQLVSSEVVRRPDAARAIPLYVLTDKCAAVAARLIATEIGNVPRA